ncbi:hypothetical protein [Robiginitalea sp. SC105]|uniref:hypothetical protein n=1 Tax=Robiginitalea sp. SC105 TaxID=2762332 RepID=UPI001639FDFE|nr:hypothetical protein [Robiginitalea sp. SC105]MBC2838427.1 hypothetical protein [Robiginitalea sp. SC105]
MDYGKHIEKRMEARVKRGVTKGFKIFFLVLFGIGVFFLVGYLLMYLWNWLMPELFGLPAVTYWQAFGILLLAKLLFGFGTGGSGGGKGKPGKNQDRAHCRNRTSHLKDKWSYYDRFWNEEGEAAFNNYIERIRNEGSDTAQETHP